MLGETPSRDYPRRRDVLNIACGATCSGLPPGSKHARRRSAPAQQVIYTDLIIENLDLSSDKGDLSSDT